MRIPPSHLIVCAVIVHHYQDIFVVYFGLERFVVTELTNVYKERDVIPVWCEVRRRGR